MVEKKSRFWKQSTNWAWNKLSTKCEYWAYLLKVVQHLFIMLQLIPYVIWMGYLSCRNIQTLNPQLSEPQDIVSITKFKKFQNTKQQKLLFTVKE